MSGYQHTYVLNMRLCALTLQAGSLHLPPSPTSFAAYNLSKAGQRTGSGCSRSQVAQGSQLVSSRTVPDGTRAPVQSWRDPNIASALQWQGELYFANHGSSALLTIDQKWQRVWLHNVSGTTDAMADKLLQIVEGPVKAGCKHGALNALEHYLALETVQENDDETINLRVSPVMHGASSILGTAKYSLAMALTKPEVISDRDFR